MRNAAAVDHYDYRMTPYLEALLRGRAADDPLVLQFRPDGRELHHQPHELPDPIGDGAHSPVPGIVHRYADRVLLKVTHLCPVYCRFCFRREMVGSKGAPLRAPELDSAIDYVQREPSIWEVIMTGGDPLALSARRVGEMLDRLAAIEHVQVLRIHTRVPIVNPDAINEAYADCFRRTKPVYIAVHVNHPDELTPSALAALERLMDGGAILLSQTVLLKGVNDRVNVLAELFRTLVRKRIRPYYLHHPDLAPGTSHFRVAIEKGQALMQELRRTVSGLCQPTYVLDIPGGFGKVPIGPTYIGIDTLASATMIRDISGQLHHYPE